MHFSSLIYCWRKAFKRLNRCSYGILANSFDCLITKLQCEHDSEIPASVLLFNLSNILIRFKLLVIHLAEDEDIVGAPAPDAGDDEDEEEGGVEETEVEEDGGGQQPEDRVDQLTHHEDHLRLRLVGVVHLAGS